LPPKVRGLGLSFLLWSLLPLQAQEILELGPFPTREMFPLYLTPMAYQPVDPTPLGCGRWRVSLDNTRANTFEFSDVFKEHSSQDETGRVAVTREGALALAAEYKGVPLLFFFDEEVVRSSLRVRYGLTEQTDVWAEFPFQSQGGGHLDGLIEWFHSLGFEQFGRDRVVKNRMAVAVISHGELKFYSDQPIRGKTQDATLGLVHRLASGPTWILSASVALKPPLTSLFDGYQSGWDHSLGLTFRWQPNARHVFYGGGDYLHRPGGSLAYNSGPFGSMRNGWGLHGTWEYRQWQPIRPFFQLYAQSGYLPRQPYQKLDRPSLQHDLGFHWQFRRNAAFTFRYLNNLTHNENTADMGLGVSLTAKF